MCQVPAVSVRLPSTGRIQISYTSDQVHILVTSSELWKLDPKMTERNWNADKLLPVPAPLVYNIQQLSHSNKFFESVHGTIRTFAGFGSLLILCQIRPVGTEKLEQEEQEASET